MRRARPATAGVAFRHDLARVVVEEALAAQPAARAPPPRARRARSPGGSADPARLAYHAEGAGDGEAVLRFAPAAAERAAAAGAHREAAAQYARALRFADGLPPAERARAARAARRTSATSPTSPARPIEELQRALECCRRARRPPRRGRPAARAVGHAAGAPALVDEAERAGREAVALLEPLGPSRELAMAYANMASLAMNDEDAERARRVGRAGARARARARRRGDRAPRAQLGRHDGVPGGRARRPRHGRAQPAARAAIGPRRRRGARATRTWSGPRCATATTARRALPERGDRVRVRPRVRPVVAVPARLPRPRRARPGALGGGGRDRGAGDPRAARVAAAACSRSP